MVDLTDAVMEVQAGFKNHIWIMKTQMKSLRGRPGEQADLRIINSCLGLCARDDLREGLLCVVHGAL